MGIPGVSVNLDKINNNRFLALLAAAVHHGLGNLAENSIPPRTNTVINTAMDFEDYLNDVPIGDGRRRK